MINKLTFITLNNMMILHCHCGVYNCNQHCLDKFAKLNGIERKIWTFNIVCNLFFRLPLV